MMTQKPKSSSGLAEKELDKAQEQFEKFDEQVKALGSDPINIEKPIETEAQTLLSQKQLSKSPDIYLKPMKRIGCKEKFNERFSQAFEYDKEHVRIIAENNEIIGEAIEMWTRPYPGVAAEFWVIPTNKPIWVPRYVANQIKRKSYRRLKTDNNAHTSTDNMGQYTGSLIADTTVQRLDARLAPDTKSVFSGSRYF